MRERPILFSAPMVLAILAGRKTVTRRLLKARHLSGTGFSMPWRGANAATLTACLKRFCPYGQPGDRFWPRETWALEDCGTDGWRIIWRADHAAAWMRPVNTWGEIFYLPSDYQLVPPHRWRPSIHMPRWASRLTLGVLDNAIDAGPLTQEQAEAEGFDSPEAFQEFFERLNGPGTINQWRWAISFNPLKQD